MTYKDAGVDIDAGNALVETIGPAARSTRRPGMMAGLGGFGGCFDLAAAGFRDPVLVAATDGVGTKLAIAHAADTHRTIGVDLVAMCVNDIVVQGAEPLFFLDYFATSRLSVAQASDVIAGIVEGCREAGCALIGGETAEMPGLYGEGEYDLAGFAVGAAERGQLVNGQKSIRLGDLILGLASSGLHANGFSLIRRLVDDRGLTYSGPSAFAPGLSLAESLLTPTRIYVRSCLAALRAGGVKAFAHITGGGLLENPPRVLPDGLAARFDLAAWPLPDVFAWVRDAGRVDDIEMLRTFNCGIGMIAIVDADSADDACASLAAAGETVRRIGEIVPMRDGQSRVEFRGAWSPWQG